MYDAMLDVVHKVALRTKSTRQHLALCDFKAPNFQPVLPEAMPHALLLQSEDEE